MDNVYQRTIRNKHGEEITVDVYDVLAAYPGINAAMDHATKKMLVTGGRSGNKSVETDMNDIIASVIRAKEVEGFDHTEQDYKAKIIELSMENSDLKTQISILRDENMTLKSPRPESTYSNEPARRYSPCDFMETMADLRKENEALSKLIQEAHTNVAKFQNLYGESIKENEELRKNADPSDLLQRKDVEIGELSKKVSELQRKLSEKL